MLNQIKIKNHFKKSDSVIFEVMKQIDFNEWFNEPKREYFESLCDQIVGQQLSRKAADSIWARFKKLFPKKRVTAKAILKLTDQQIRDIGMSWGKVKYVKDLADKVIKGELDLKRIHDLSDEEVMKSLIRVKGIGPWTAEMFLIFTLKRYDVYSFGDLGLTKTIIKLYKLKNPTRSRMEKIIKRWSPYKSFGALSLWYHQDNV